MILTGTTDFAFSSQAPKICATINSSNQIMLPFQAQSDLSFHEAKRVLMNFLKSELPFLLTTTHILPASHKNTDILTGDFRLMDLFAVPYCFPRDAAFSIDDWLAPDARRELCLWTREQVATVVQRFEVG